MLFEREFIEPQEALGAHVLATFRNIDNPDRFVWLRGFADFDARFARSTASTPARSGRRRRAQANAAMIDSDDVLLLRPIAGGIARDPAARSPIGAAAPDASSPQPSTSPRATARKPSPPSSATTSRRC